MLVSELRVRNARCFVKVALPLHPRFTVIIGENGAGKTTLAELLGSFAGDDEGLAGYPLRFGTRAGEARLVQGRKTLARFGTSQRITVPVEILLFAYGRYRRVETDEYQVGKVQLSQAGVIGTEELLGPEWVEAEKIRRAGDLESLALRPRTTSLTRPDNGLLRDVAHTLAALWQRRNDPRVDAAWRVFQNAIRHLGQQIDDVAVEERHGRQVPVVRRAGVTLALRELSDGYQAILVVVLDLLLRYMHASPREDFAAERGLVVIDEVDLHLHPRWQRLVVKQLTDTFPRTQFVVTTHSGAVVQGAIDGGFPIIRLHERLGRTEADVISGSAERRLRGASISSLLVQERLFAVGSLYGIGYEACEEKARMLAERVRRGKATEKELQTLREILFKLEDVVARDEELRGEGGFLATLVHSQRAFAERLATFSETKTRKGQGQ